MSYRFKSQGSRAGLPFITAVAAIVALLVAASAPATASPVNLVQNGGFELTSLATTGYVCVQDGSAACSSQVTGWDSTCVVFGCVPDTHDVLFEMFPDNLNAYNGGAGIGNVTPSPQGGKFIASDGFDPSFAAPIFQTINGLRPGEAYRVSFDQAATEQGGGTAETFEQWQVALGGEIKLSALMVRAPSTFFPWESQSLTFIATGTSEVLSFLAIGLPNVPPVVLLDGVSLTAVPEPSALALLATGLVAALGAVGVRRSKRNRMQNQG